MWIEATRQGPVDDPSPQPRPNPVIVERTIEAIRKTFTAEQRRQIAAMILSDDQGSVFKPVAAC